MDHRYSILLLVVLLVACEGQDRPTWGLSEDTFSLLPTPYLDFEEVVRSSLSDDEALSTLDEAYWKQPEFYPGFFDVGLPLMLNSPPGRWGAAGVMVYPSTNQAHMVSGSSRNFSFFVASGYLVQSYQAFRLSNTLQDQNDTLDEGQLRLLFDVFAPTSALLVGPSYPVYHPNWTSQVRFNVSVSPSTPNGTYLVSFYLEPPSAPESGYFLQEYGGLYYDRGVTHNFEAYHTLALHVEKK